IFLFKGRREMGLASTGFGVGVGCCLTDICGASGWGGSGISTSCKDCEGVGGGGASGSESETRSTVIISSISGLLGKNDGIY
ncbi:MAG: hypothetical protein OEM02_14380, partial [Desulfobulbaceae bacterium]|nr:hypothetical protein [Desulfobulbaceae bacterium]